jgi:hypothetical protein
MLIPEDRQREEPEIMSRIRKGERIDHYETIRRAKGRHADRYLAHRLSDQERHGPGDRRLENRPRHQRAQTRRTAARAASRRAQSPREEHAGDGAFGRAANRFPKPLPLEEARDAFTAAFAPSHTRTRGSPRPAGTAFRCIALVADELAPYSGEDGTHARLSGPEIELDPKRAVMLGMAFHELATNAAKHGACPAAAGR